MGRTMSPVALTHLPLIAGASCTITAGGQWIEPAPGATEYDPAWTFVDAARHGHFYGVDSSYLDLRFPTLHAASQCAVCLNDECEGGTTEDCYPEHWFECAICGEKIEPGTRPAKAVFIDEPPVVHLELTRAEAGSRTTITADLSGQVLRDIETLLAQTLAHRLMDLANEHEIDMTMTHEGA